MKNFNGKFGLYNYDTSLFYRNDRAFDGADPGALWVSKEDDPVYGGYFYCVVTGGELNDGTRTTGAFTCYRSKDLNAWEKCGAVNGYALQINPTDWCMQDFWAPEYFHEKITVNGKIKNRYYLYFNALSKQGNENTEYSSSPIEEGRFNRFYLGIAVSDNPRGPFTLVDTSTYYKFYGETRTTDLNGNIITGSTPTFNFYKNNPEIEAEYKKRGIKLDNWPALDISPFKDPATGEFYCYFSHHPSTYSFDIYIWVVKMKDFITPDFSTMHTITLAGYNINSSDFKLYVNDGKTDYSQQKELTDKLTRFYYDGSALASGINEGAHTIAHFDERAKKWLYYLTYSPFGFPSRAYSILQAVSHSPYGPFKKLPPHEGQVVIGILNWDKNSQKQGEDFLDYSCTNDLSSAIDYSSGCGHHSFAKTGSEVFAVYHTLANSLDNYRSGRFMGRRMAVDRVLWTYSPTLTYEFLDFKGNTQPLPLLYGLGQTHSLQPLPKVSTPCRDIINKAKITASGNASGVQNLVESGFVVHSAFTDREFSCEGDTVISVEFGSVEKLRAIMLYNSCKYAHALASIYKIEVSTPSGVVELQNVEQDSQNIVKNERVMRYGGAIICDFEIEATQIELYLRAEDKLDKSNQVIKTGGLVVLANCRDTDCQIQEGNCFGKVEKVEGDLQENSYQFESGKISYKKYSKADKIRVLVEYEGKIFHADEKGERGFYQGYERWYKNTAIRLEGENCFAEVSAYSVRARGANANILKRQINDKNEGKLVAEFYFNAQPQKMVLTLPKSEIDLQAEKIEIELKV